jgi:hypothetical protein
MEAIVDFAGVAGAIGVSVALALWIEWVSLRGLMRLMPVKAAAPAELVMTGSGGERRTRKAA